MKNIFIVFFVSCFTLALTAQSERSISHDEWLLSVGLNTVNSLGSKNPFSDPGDWAYKFPLAVSIEGKWFDLFSIEVAASLMVLMRMIVLMVLDHLRMISLISLLTRP